MQVYSKSFVYLYNIIDAAETLIDSVYVGRGSLTMILPVSHDAVYFIEKNGWLVTEDGEPFIVKVIEQGQSQVTYTAYSGHAYISQRVAKKEYITMTGSADAVVKHFIDQLKGEGTAALAATTAPVKQALPETRITSEQIRLTNLGDKVQDILSAANLGEKFTLHANQGIEFDTYEGVDRSVGNTEDNPNVIFALEYGNVDQPTYTQDCTKEQTTVYVAGPGEGDDRQIYILGGGAEGSDRVEVVVDASDIDAADPDKDTKLAERAAQYLIGDNITVSATAIANSNLKYGRNEGDDFFLGDICTIKVKVKSYVQNGDFYDRAESTVNVNKRLVEVTKSYKGGSMDMDLVFGTLTPSKASVTKKEVEALKALDSSSSGVPAGVVNPYAGGQAPDGWLLCDGTEVSRTDYESLFSVVGTLYGNGDGSTTFNVPNLKGRVPAGYNGSDLLFDTMGETGGEAAHALAEGEMPSHTHTQDSHTHAIGHTHGSFTTGADSPGHTHTFSGTTNGRNTSHTHRASTGSYKVGSGSTSTYTYKTDNGSTSPTNTGTESNDHTHTYSGTTGQAGHTHGVTISAFTGTSGGTAAVNQNAGGGGAHNNMPPYIVLNYIIKT